MNVLRLIQTSVLTLTSWMLPATVFSAGVPFQKILLDDEPVLYYQFNEAAAPANNFPQTKNTRFSKRMENLQKIR